MVTVINTREDGKIIPEMVKEHIGFVREKTSTKKIKIIFFLKLWKKPPFIIIFS